MTPFQLKQQTCSGASSQLFYLVVMGSVSGCPSTFLYHQIKLASTGQCLQALSSTSGSSPTFGTCSNNPVDATQTFLVDGGGPVPAFQLLCLLGFFFTLQPVKDPPTKASARDETTRKTPHPRTFFSVCEPGACPLQQCNLSAMHSNRCQYLDQKKPGEENISSRK